MSNFRIEKDSMGELNVPIDALYGAQTQRAIDNFKISGYLMPRSFIRALVMIKAAAARANAELGHLDPALAMSIVTAAEHIARGDHLNQFPLDVFQTGSGTSSYMNAKEVIANLAGTASGHLIDANDHVNMSQSSNDVVPSAIALAALMMMENDLRPALGHLIACLRQREFEFAAIIKTGRTHLMDAMPMSLGQEFSAWIAQLKNADERLASCRKRLSSLPLGGTAIGTGINADPKFAARVCERLSDFAGVEISSCENKFAKIAALDDVVEYSAHLRSLAIALMKIANDLRWMNSGPLAGLGELELPALQPGSSIMPGKVNPVIPEALVMVCAQVIGMDTTVAIAGQSGNFQLNVMMPVMAYNVLEATRLLANAQRALADQVILGLRVRENNLQNALQRNPILITALNPVIGYAQGAAIAKRAYTEARSVLDVAIEMTSLSEVELRALLDPSVLARGGLVGSKPGSGGG